MNDFNYLENIVKYFEMLPGVGKKTALRYAYYVVEHMSNEVVEGFSNNLVQAKKNITHCECCGVLTTKRLCDVCSNSSRDHSQIMVVKSTKDVLAIEKANFYKGLYHVLNGLISPLDGIGPNDINIASLENKTKNEQVREVIISTSFTPAGEMTALYLEKVLARDGLKISRIGYGLPAGGDIEYVDELTLKRAIESRNTSKE